MTATTLTFGRLRMTSVTSTRLGADLRALHERSHEPRRRRDPGRRCSPVGGMAYTSSCTIRSMSSNDCGANPTQCSRSSFLANTSARIAEPRMSGPGSRRGSTVTCPRIARVLSVSSLEFWGDVCYGSFLGWARSSRATPEVLQQPVTGTDEFRFGAGFRLRIAQIGCTWGR